MDSLRRAMSDRTLEFLQEESTPTIRPLEDPHLVGEEAAARARRDRLARESGDDILVREDRQWDCFLGKSHKKTSCTMA